VAEDAKHPSRSPKAWHLGALQAMLQLKDDASPNAWSKAQLQLRGAKELRRLDHAVRWVRRDPVDEIPPGVTSEVAFKVTVGVTEEGTQSLARAMDLKVGLKAGVDFLGLQSEINRQLTATVSTTLSISQTEETTKTLTLENQSENSIRLYALWQLRNRLRVSRLGRGPNDTLAWIVCSEEEFLSSDAVTIKSFTLSAS
jgi:hypothetical protein